MFHEVRLPVSLAFGAQGSMERKTEILTLASGHEERNTPWKNARRRWDVGVTVQSLKQLEQIRNFFETRRGRLYGFRFKDPFDHRSGSFREAPTALDQKLAVGDGKIKEFQLVKRYGSPEYESVRKISKPIIQSIKLAINSKVLKRGLDYKCDVLTGKITLHQALKKGEKLTAGYLFDCPVRFDTDRLEISLSTFQAGHIPSIPIIEILI